MVRTFIALGLLSFVLGACDLPRAHGDASAVIVGADVELWEEVEASFLDAMAPTIQTVREERPFRITQQDPFDLQYWNNLRRFRQVLVMGEADDPWVAEALERYDGELGEPPILVQVHDVWARGQQVSVLILPASGQAEAVNELAGVLQGILDQQFRDYARTRMYVSGRNEELADSLAVEFGFALTFPNVYRVAEREDSFLRIRNDNPNPRELIREVGVTWVSPIPEELPDQSELEEWRHEFANERYNDPQELDLSVTTHREIDVNGYHGVEFQSAWASPEGAWPAGGPFITRAMVCPERDRLYLIDAWVYAPERDKYEYVIQLQNILNSFECR